MGQVAFVFPGQGAQYPGMGKELAEASTAAAVTFRRLNELRPGTSEQCFVGPADALQETANCQPCLFAVEIAAAAALAEAGIYADVVAGFSLGELAALSYCQIVDESTTFKLVCRRGELMQACAAKFDTAMAAVVKLDNTVVERLCAGFEGVYPVNYNCPGQVTVALGKESMAAFSAAVKAAGGRALPLKVSGGFHSPYMAEAAAAFGNLLEDAAFRESPVTLYSNVTGKPYDGDRKQLLSRQICSPVRWEATVRDMIASGVDTFIEVGPGNVLQGLIKKIDPTVRVFGVSDRESLETVKREVAVC